MPSRRQVVLSALGLGAASGAAYLFTSNHSIPAADPAAEEKFRDLQDALSAHYGLTATSRFYEISDPRLRVHVIESGKGDPALFIHGGNSVAAGWIPLLAKLQERFRLYAPDRPGCGLTTKFRYSGVPLRAHAINFVGAVMDRLEVSRAAIVGNSMGGYFGLVYALAHPERVSKLVLVGEPAGSAPRVTFPNRLVGTRMMNSALFATVLKPGLEATRNGFQNILVADVRRVPSFYLECMAAGSEIPGATESWITMIESVFKPEGAGLFAPASTLTYALIPELGRLVVPTLMLWGEKDTFGPPALGEEMARMMPDGRCEILPDAGHLAWMDQLDLCAEKIGKFLS